MRRKCRSVLVIIQFAMSALRRPAEPEPEPNTRDTDEGRAHQAREVPTRRDGQERMRDAVDHSGNREEPGGEERDCPRRPQSPNRGDPDPDPRQVEYDEQGKRNAWQPKQGSQALVKTGRRFLGEVDALNPDCKSERMRGGESLRHVFGRARMAQDKEQGGERCQTQNEHAGEHVQQGP